MHASAAHRRPRETGVIALASGAGFLALLDATVVNLAVPGIRADFPTASLADVSWTISGYAVVFAALLASTGRWADVVGARRLYGAGVGVFTLFSLACTVAPGLGLLIAARAVQGAGAAAMIPASLAILLLGVRPERRAAAIGVWSAVGSLAAAVGPSLGGVLVDTVGWRALFAVNVPVGLVLCWYARSAPGRHTGGELPDLFGTALLAAGLGAFVLGVGQGPSWGWTSISTLGAIVGGLLVLGWALVRSVRHPRPAVDVALWRSRGFRRNSVAAFLYGSALYSALLIGVLFLTEVWRYSELRAGLAMSAGAITAALSAAITGRVTGRFGPRPAVVAGAVIMAAAAVWLAIGLPAEPSFLQLWLPSGLLLGTGMGAVAAGTNTAAALFAPPGGFAGAVGLTTTARQLGGALGIAALTVILQTASDDGLQPYAAVYWFVALVVLVAAAVALRLVPASQPAEKRSAVRVAEGR